MSLTDEQIRKAGGIVHRDGNIFFKSIDQLNSAIESAATAPLLERIAELEERNRDLHEDVKRFRAHALNEKDARMALEREREALRKDVLEEAVKVCESR